MTSRLTVEAARFIRLAISRMDESEAIPREISSRSARVRARGDRRRAAGPIPPRGYNTDRMQLCSLPKARPISCSDCPTFQRFQTSPFSIAESPNLFPGLMPTPPFQNERFIRWCCIDLSNGPDLSGASPPARTEQRILGTYADLALRGCETCPTKSGSRNLK